MASIVEGLHPGEGVISEASGARSRDVGTLITGQDLDSGTVLGEITVGGKFTQLAPAAVDGSEVAAGILYYPVDASGADAACVVWARDIEVHGASLVWPAGITGPEQAAAEAELKAAHIIVRS